MITIANKRLREYLEEKDTLVLKGRKISFEIEGVDKKINVLKDEQRKFTEACNPKELIIKGDSIEKEVNKMLEELSKIGDEVQKLKIANIPKEKVAKYEALKKEKEEKERERSKIALKVQKIKDRCIPIIQKEVKPFLKSEYDDIETAEVKNDKIIVKTFNHLDDWKAKFGEKNKKEVSPIKSK